MAFGASSVTVPADIAERINERIAYVSNGASGNEALDEELSQTNCRGAAATVLFGSAGNANVFQKGNMSSNYPWELMSLEQLFDTYCVPDNHGHEQGLRIAKPKL